MTGLETQQAVQQAVIRLPSQVCLARRCSALQRPLRQETKRVEGTKRAQLALPLLALPQLKLQQAKMAQQVVSW